MFVLVNPVQHANLTIASNCEIGQKRILQHITHHTGNQQFHEETERHDQKALTQQQRQSHAISRKIINY